MSSSASLVPTYDVDAAAAALSGDPNLSITDLLTQLTSPPPVEADAKTSVMPKKTELPAPVVKAMDALPTLFGTVQPATRRTLNKPEQARIADERAAIDLVIKALEKRKTEIQEIVSTHFDVDAEKKGLADSETARDEKGHYMIASPGAPELQYIPGHKNYWARQRQGDKTVPSETKLKAAYDKGEISKEEYYAVTRPVSDRVIDEDRIRKMMVSAEQRPVVQKVLSLISVTTRGRNSIYLKTVK